MSIQVMMPGSKQTAESSEDSSETSSEPESAQGFPIIYAVAGIVLLTFGSNLGGNREGSPEDLSKRICTGNVKISR